MYGYIKTMRLCLTEYFLALVLHIIYAFVHGGIETGRLVLLISSALFIITLLVVMFAKNEKFVVYFTYLSVTIATGLIGYILDTMTFGIFILFIMSVVIAIFMDTTYLVVSGIISTSAFIFFAIVFPDKILTNLAHRSMFYIYILLYIVAYCNLYIVVGFAKKSVQGMEAKADDAVRANQSKMIFLANMSHEIRTPMNAIVGMTELTLREENLPKEARENLENIQTASKVLSSIVNDILDYSKLESGKMEIIPVSYPFRKLVDDVISMMSVRMEDKEIDLRADISDEVPEYLIGDEIRIRQILFNLLSNAIKYTDKGYVILDVKGTNDAGFSDLIITVTDSGIGIKKDDLGKIFTSFNHLDSRKIKDKDGTGLGLSICKNLVTFMGGTIEVESTYGVGSKFIVKISQKISDENKGRPNIKNVNEPLVNAPDAKVLVVDDNAVNLKVAQGLLKTFGISVDICKSGRECLDILRNTKDYDIIFIDHMMPELDGIDTLNLIRADSSDYMKKVPLIALTANVVSGVRDMFIEEGFNDYVPKPIDMVWLNGILRKYLPLEKQR